MPFAHSARTLPAVSAPSRVVRSIIEMARSMAYAFAVVLTDRVPRPAARASSPTASTPGSPCRKRRSAFADAVASAKPASRPGASAAYAGTTEGAGAGAEVGAGEDGDGAVDTGDGAEDTGDAEDMVTTPPYLRA